MQNKNQKAVEIYDKIAEEYSQVYDSIDGEEDLVFLNSFVSLIKEGSYIVDLGCGTGFSTGWFAKKGMRGEACDLSSKMIRIARRNYPDLKFSISDMSEFSPSEKADAVWAGYSLFHYETNDFHKTITKIKTYLKPDGIFGLVMQEGEGEVEIPEPFLPSETIYLHLYTEEELTSILIEHGFEIIKVQRKESKKHHQEFEFNKLLVIGRLIK